MNRNKELQTYPERMRKCGKVIKNAIAVMDECKIVADTLMDAADLLESFMKDMPSKSEGKKKEIKAIEESSPATESAPPKKEYTLVDVRGVLASKSKAGLSSEVRALISKYGGEKLSDVPSENYAALVAEAEELTNA